jgi:hypothetical protein
MISRSLWASTRERDFVGAFWIRPANCGDIFAGNDILRVSDDRCERRNLDVTAMINEESSVDKLATASSWQGLVL